MTADDGMSAVHVVLAGAVQPDASGGVGDPLARHIVTLDLSALRERLSRWSFDSQFLGYTTQARDRMWGMPEYAHVRERHYRYVDALLAELGRGTG